MKNILFLTDLDGTLLNDRKKIGKRSEDILNELISKGLKLGISSARTPATMTGILKNMNLNLPVCAMNGAAIYDISKNEYTRICTISDKTAEVIFEICKKGGISPFIHIIRDKRLFIYYEDFESAPAKEFYNERKNLKGKTYIKAPFREGLGEVIYFTVLGNEKSVHSILEDIKASEVSGDVTLNYYRDIYNEGFFFLEVCHSTASKETGLEYLKALSGADTVYAFGDNLNDIPMLMAADKSFAVANAPSEVKALCSETIGDNNSDSVALAIQKIYEREIKQ